MAAAPISQRGFIAVSALLFALSAAVTIVWCGAMSAMGAMPMPGGWTLSMAWMPMCGQPWADAAVSFMAMWIVMMVGMMLPSLVPTLWRYREAVGGTATSRLGLLTALVGTGYFLVWTLLGITAYPLGAALAAAEMQLPALARAVPAGVGVVVLLAGALQFTAGKARHLARCRGETWRDATLPADAGTALRTACASASIAAAAAPARRRSSSSSASWICGSWLLSRRLSPSNALRRPADVLRISSARSWSGRVVPDRTGSGSDLYGAGLAGLTLSGQIWCHPATAGPLFVGAVGAAGALDEA